MSVAAVMWDPELWLVCTPGHRGLHGDQDGRWTGLLGMQLHCGCSPCSLSGTQLAYRSMGRAMQGNNAFLVWPATILSGAAGGSSAWRWTMEVWTCLAKKSPKESSRSRSSGLSILVTVDSTVTGKDGRLDCLACNCIVVVRRAH